MEAVRTVEEEQAFVIWAPLSAVRVRRPAALHWAALLNSCEASDAIFRRDAELKLTPPSELTARPTHVCGGYVRVRLEDSGAPPAQGIVGKRTKA